MFLDWTKTITKRCLGLEYGSPKEEGEAEENITGKDRRKPKTTAWRGWGKTESL